MCTHTREYTASVRLLRSVRLCTLFVHRAAHIITTHARASVWLAGLVRWFRCCTTFYKIRARIEILLSNSNIRAPCRARPAISGDGDGDVDVGAALVVVAMVVATTRMRSSRYTPESRSRGARCRQRIGCMQDARVAQSRLYIAVRRPVTSQYLLWSRQFPIQ